MSTRTKAHGTNGATGKRKLDATDPGVAQEVHTCVHTTDRCNELDGDRPVKLRKTVNAKKAQTSTSELGTPDYLHSSSASSKTRALSASPSVSEDLMDLLDFTKLEGQAAIEERFRHVASILLQEYCIEVRTKESTERLEFLEIEFYLYASGSHEDPFTHASAEQSQSGRWYFHRPPSRSHGPGTPTTTPSGYRGGTRKGMDITFGQPPPSRTSKFFQTSASASSQVDSSENSAQGVLRGGILLRSVRRMSDSKVISGPSLLVDEVLRLNEASSISELVQENWGGDISAFSTTSYGPSASSPIPLGRRSAMSLMHKHSFLPSQGRSSGADSKSRIYRSPRIGLDISHQSIEASTALSHPRVQFITKSYRFFVHPHLLTANGRGQTFIGVYDALLARGEDRPDSEALDESELLAEIVKLTGLKSTTAEKYLGDLQGGLEGGKLSQWIGPKGKVVTSNVGAWLRMIGTLRQLRTAQ